jgi:hypothetical protein
MTGEKHAGRFWPPGAGDRATPDRAIADRGTRAAARGSAASILRGPCRGWPACPRGAGAPWHEPPAGPRRPRGWSEVRCQIPAADPVRYPECSLIGDDAGPCDCYCRQAQRRTS